ncbi:MAG: 16S rRNA (adenine(1518)-N(6)/adenine(1519)-N(6))-dimethyltransferase RsmA [Acidobacteriota bacterium]|jgi:16S rRNA (adenine1518-N6/adenine1519-N6)-dimethyltransferase|nr:16S rRNA (adenine(1518)-N(6)/adenine(1519)-N(6))-dimethyltransferase RsmA [Acidobacteriota bacterium]
MEATANLVKTGAPVAKKRLGQHFLKDAGMVDRIVRWMAPAPDQAFVEIGAGTGALSTHLAEKAAALVAVELDEDCLPVLEKALAPFDGASVVAGDILSLDFAGLVAERLPASPSGLRLRVAGNLPYNIGTAIIEKLLHCEFADGTRIDAMFFMLQLEVAERILARPGTKEYGYLSVMCRHRAEARMGFKVPPACFAPRPKVMSAVVSLHPKGRAGGGAGGGGGATVAGAGGEGDAARRPPAWDAAWESDFEDLVKAGFAHRRKTLANSLSRSPRFGAVAPRLLAEARIDGARRAESLAVAEYERLADVLRRL